MMEQQIESLNQNLSTIENNIQDVKGIIDSMGEFSKLNKGDKILVSLSNGIFVNATLEDPTALKVNVGKNTVVDKTVDQVKNMMSDQLVELETYQKETEKYYAELVQRVELSHQELIAHGEVKAN